MIQITFEKDEKNRAVLRSTEEKTGFVINEESFENRSWRFMEDALLFDGYSIWFSEEAGRWKTREDFAVSLVIAPLGYSDRGDGLLSLFDREKREGFYILLKKFGKVEVGFGDGRELFCFESIRENLKKDFWNILTVVYRQEAGWCDLYINGALSNRKQFRRHTPVKWPEGSCFLGKFVDRTDYRESTPDRIYYGLMQRVMIEEESPSAESIRKLHAQYPCRRLKQEIRPDRRDYENDRQRPQYHLIPPGKWMNEPHAPFYYEGWYHIFYQANPHAPVWNNIQWGHMVSKDMVHWSDMPLALEVEEHADPDGCWSGSALVDQNGVPHIFYTAGNNEKFPNQSVAAAKAVTDADKKLEKWKKQKDFSVEQSIGWLGEFRDPFVWAEGDGYFMLVGTGDENNGGGNAVLYSSKDLKSWECHGFFLDYDYEKNQEAGHVWELPVLLPLRDESGEIACHILLLCACQIEREVVETYGFLGRWEAKSKTFRKFNEKALLLDLGNGTFTGPSGFVTPDHRSVVFTIAQGKREGSEEYHAGWAHNGGIPVELFVRNQELRFRPIREIYGLLKKKRIHLEDVTLEEANQYLEQISGNRIYMKICADAEELAVETQCGRQDRTVYYDRRKCRLGALDESGREIGKYRRETDGVDLDGEDICLEYFLDHSMIEAYLNERKSVTLRNYGRWDERRIRLQGEVKRIRSLEVWEMASAYQEERED
ncbi:MAG: glycoside hydrolase family 32 protein [Eubacteriales bacterium]|nr:glycoside hydrolase family 32 protein [Eubacteriales bacterium]